MQSISTYRIWQLSKLKKAPAILEQLLANISQEDATTYRDGGKGWTVLEVMSHLRDYEEVFIERATLTLNEDNPTLPNPDPDKLAAEREYNKGNLAEVFDAWKANRSTYRTLLKDIGDEATWDRPAQHPRRGPFTLHDQLFLVAWHDANHFEQIANIMREKLK